MGATDIHREDLHRSVTSDLHRPALEPWFYIDLHILTNLDYLERERERERGRENGEEREERKYEERIARREKI